MKRKDKPIHPNGYARIGSVYQQFRSNSDMARHFFKELLEDGQEHSAKEINEYIFDKTGSTGVDGARLTDETIHSAIWYLFRHDHDLSYIQIRKGYYQRNTVENLLGDGPNSFRSNVVRVLSDAKKIIQQFASVPNLTEREQLELTPMKNAIMKEVENAFQAICASNLGQEVMTRDNLFVDSELIIIDDHINAYLGAWFDVDKRFKTETYGTDEYINLYADYYPADVRLDVFFVHHGSDGGEIVTKPVDDLTDSEREVILQLMKEIGLDNLVAEMSEEQDSGMVML